MSRHSDPQRHLLRPIVNPQLYNGETDPFVIYGRPMIVSPSLAAKDQLLGWTQTVGITSSIIHQMKAKNLRIQKLREAGTKQLYNSGDRTVPMATFLK